MALRIISFLVAIVLFVPVGAKAVESIQPRASYYLDS